MLEYLKDITPEQTRRVDELLATNFENATSEDIELYANWKTAIALQNADFEIKREAMEREAQARHEIAQEAAEQSKNALDELVAVAKRRLELVENG